MKRSLKGIDGKILTTTDARGIEIGEIGESRIEPVAGYDLTVSLDRNIQEYAQQEALRVMEQKEAEAVSILIMNPQNGEIYACVNVPEFDLNDPFTLNDGTDESTLSEEELQERLNQMWRNICINDTYEPGSTFKVITAAAGLESGAVTLKDSFYCPGYRVVDDRRIHCANRNGHGSETFVQGVENSCNPVFIDVALRMGVDEFYSYFEKFGLLEKTGIDLPGEAGTITHRKEDMGAGGAGHHGFRAVLSDYAGEAGGHGILSHQRGIPDYAAFGHGGPGRGRKCDPDLQLREGAADPVGGDL